MGTPAGRGCLTANSDSADSFTPGVGTWLMCVPLCGAGAPQEPTWEHSACCAEL